MNDHTINADVTMTDEGQALLANRYRVVKPLGQGGMGSVWLAEDTKLDGHRVAIKMLPSVLVSNKRAYAQVKQEALVSLKLSHPNIVSVRAFEEDERGNPFLVMDYVDGRTLDDVLAEKGKLSEEETLRLLKPIAAALDYAHTQGVVHRDVKPGNVMIRSDGHPFILDFGIAREVQETLTRVTGKLSSGTLLYMSPEQLNGDAPKPAQDVYSFAAMVYECLAGNPPFFRGAIEDQIKNKQPPPLGPHFIKCGPVVAGLAKDPASRPATCATVLTGDFTRQSYRKTESRSQSKGLWGVLLVLSWLGAGLAAWHGLSAGMASRKAELSKIVSEANALEQRVVASRAARATVETSKKDVDRQVLAAKSRLAQEQRRAEAAEVLADTAEKEAVAVK